MPINDKQREAFLSALDECLYECEEANALWGEASQRGMAIEEMGELLTALNQLSRGRVDNLRVAEESADVLITVLQLAVSSIGIENVTRFLSEKRIRLEERILDAKTEAELKEQQKRKEAEEAVVTPRKGMIFLLEEKDWQGIWHHHVDWNEETWASAEDLDSGDEWTWNKVKWENALRSGEVTILEMGEDPPAAGENIEDDAVESSEED